MGNNIQWLERRYQQLEDLGFRCPDGNCHIRLSNGTIYTVLEQDIIELDRGDWIERIAECKDIISKP